MLDRARAGRPGTMRLLSWLTPYVRRRWVELSGVLVAMLLKIGLDVVQPWPMKVLVDHALGSKPMPPRLAAVAAMLPGALTREGLVFWSIAATIVVFVLGWAIGLLSSYTNVGFGQRMVYDLAADLFGHLQRLSLRFHSRKSIGDSIRRVTTDCGCVATIVRDAILPIFMSVFSLIAMFAIMIRLDLTLSLLAIAIIPAMALVLKRYIGPMFDRSYELQEAEGQIYDVVEQTLSAIPVVQAFGREEREDQRFRAATATIVDRAIDSTKVDLKFNTFLGIATAVGTAGVLYLGARHVLDGQLTVGTVLVFLSYLSAFYGPLEAIMYTPSTTQGALGSALRVFEILETRQEVTDRPNGRAIRDVEGDIRFDRVTFGYEAQRPVLHDVSFGVAPGQQVAIVGPTGAGKSTLVSLVPRFFDPSDGRVTLDGNDLRDITLKSLRERVAIVLQEPFLFPLTIADNIAYGRPHASRPDIEAAASAANAHAFIERLPRGYDTVIGELGATLSGGERQRLSIARALLKDAPILILDEPTSALDAATEATLLDALERLMRGRTTFIIAHRLSTIRKADKIVTLQDGRVAETGTHDELLKLGGVYARFHELQFGSGRLASGS